MRSLFKSVNGWCTEHVDTVLQVLHMAFVGVCAGIPCVRRNVHILLDIGLDLHDVSRTGLAAELPATVRRRFIIEHQEVVVVPVCCIETDDCRLAHTVEIFNCHVEDAIIFGFVINLGLFS